MSAGGYDGTQQSRPYSGPTLTVSQLWRALLQVNAFW